MRIIPSENNGFVLITFDFTFLNQFLFLSTNAFQKNGGWFSVRVLWYKFTLNGFLENGFFKSLWENIVQMF